MTGGQAFFKAMGERLWEEVLARDYERGALSFLILAPKGQGKSTLLATITLKALELGDLVVWRGRHRDFWPRLPRKLVKIFVYADDELKVLRIQPGTSKAVDITEQLDIEKYKTIEELYRQLEPGRINVVYEPSYHQPSEELREIAETDAEWLPGRFFWYDFLDFLAHRVDARFLSLCLDEIDDIFPAGASGMLWRALEHAQHSLAELRERLVWLYGTTHDPAHLDSRILKKLDGFIYLRGALVPKISMMPDKSAPARLDIGQGIIEIRGRGYGGFEFDKLPHDGYLYNIQKSWQGPEVHVTKRSIKEQILELAEEEGPERALIKLREAFMNGQISQRYYYLLKNLIEGRV